MLAFLPLQSPPPLLWLGCRQTQARDCIAPAQGGVCGSSVTPLSSLQHFRPGLPVLCGARAAGADSGEPGMLLPSLQAPSAFQRVWGGSSAPAAIPGSLSTARSPVSPGVLWVPLGWWVSPGCVLCSAAGGGAGVFGAAQPLLFISASPLSCLASASPFLQEAGDNNQFCWRNLFSCINLLRILNKLTKWKHSRTMVRAGGRAGALHCTHTLPWGRRALEGWSMHAAKPDLCAGGGWHSAAGVPCIHPSRGPPPLPGCAHRCWWCSSQHPS